MAQYLPEPDTRHIRAERGVQDDTAASVVQGLSGLMDFATGAAARKEVAAEKQRVAEGGEAMSVLSSDLLSLQDERSRLVMEDEELTRQYASIHADNIVTEEEQGLLDSLSAQKDRLDRARKSGVLNPAAYSLRKNAMHKQALADVGHLNIQGNVNALFGSYLAQPQSQQSAASMQIENSLNATYGVGGWGAEEKGQYLGNQLFVAQKQQEGAVSITNLNGQVSNLTAAVNDGALRGLLKSAADKGAIMPADKQAYLTLVTAQFSGITAQFENAIIEAQRRGEVLDMDAIKAMRDDLAVQRKHYTLDIFNEDLADMGVQARMEKALKIQQLKIEANAPAGAQAAIALGLGGAGGSGGQDFYLQLSNMSERDLAGLIPDGSPLTGKELKASAQKALEYFLTADYTFDQMVSDGVITQTLATFMTNNLIKNINTNDSPAAASAFTSAIEGFKGSATLNSAEFTESINAFAQHANKIGTKGGPKDAERAREVLRDQSKRIFSEIRENPDILVRLDEGGRPIVYNPSVMAQRAGELPRQAGRLGSQLDTKISKLQKDADALFESYSAYERAGVASVSEMGQEFSKAPDPVKIEEGEFRIGALPTAGAKAKRKYKEGTVVVVEETGEELKVEGGVYVAVEDQPEQSGGAGQGPLLSMANQQPTSLDISLPPTPREFGDAYGKIVGEDEASRRNYYRDFPAIDKLVQEGMSLDDAIREATKLPTIEPEGTLLQDEEGNKFRVVGGKYVREQ
ncbi:hypothetical protein OAP25_01030 [Flavobacteriaceae bacterium]|nr:hypothetical protein [Flavobacteriaceae bacterium]